MSVKELEAETRYASSIEFDYDIDPKIEKQLVMRLDLIVCPTLGIVSFACKFPVVVLSASNISSALLYLTNTLDRANLGNAKTDTLEKDLHLFGHDYSLVLIFFYVPFAIFNIPASILANRTTPAIVTPLLVIGWGTLAMITAAVRNFGGLLGCRLILGLMEAGFMPCAMLYCSLFYTRKELAFRLALFGIMGYVAVCFRPYLNQFSG